MTARVLGSWHGQFNNQPFTRPNPSESMTATILTGDAQRPYLTQSEALALKPALWIIYATLVRQGAELCGEEFILPLVRTSEAGPAALQDLLPAFKVGATTGVAKSTLIRLTKQLIDTGLVDRRRKVAATGATVGVGTPFVWQLTEPTDHRELDPGFDWMGALDLMLGECVVSPSQAHLFMQLVTLAHGTGGRRHNLNRRGWCHTTGADARKLDALMLADDADTYGIYDCELDGDGFYTYTLGWPAPASAEAQAARQAADARRRESKQPAVLTGFPGQVSSDIEFPAEVAERVVVIVERETDRLGRRIELDEQAMIVFQPVNDLLELVHGDVDAACRALDRALAAEWAVDFGRYLAAVIKTMTEEKRKEKAEAKRKKTGPKYLTPRDSAGREVYHTTPQRYVTPEPDDADYPAWEDMSYLLAEAEAQVARRAAANPSAPSEPLPADFDIEDFDVPGPGPALVADDIDSLALSMGLTPDPNDEAEVLSHA